MLVAADVAPPARSLHAAGEAAACGPKSPLLIPEQSAASRCMLLAGSCPRTTRVTRLRRARTRGPSSSPREKLSWSVAPPGRRPIHSCAASWLTRAHTGPPQAPFEASPVRSVQLPAHGSPVSVPAARLRSAPSPGGVASSAPGEVCAVCGVWRGSESKHCTFSENLLAVHAVTIERVTRATLVWKHRLQAEPESHPAPRSPRSPRSPRPRL